MDQLFMQEALKEAEKAGAAGEVPVGAVMVCDGEIIARAHNTREAENDPTAHAEMSCIRAAAKVLGNWRLSRCRLYVTLEPCPMCAGAMVMSRLGECVYGAYDEKQGCCGSVYDLPGDAALASQTKWQGGVMEEECKALMQRFFQKKREPV